MSDRRNELKDFKQKINLTEYAAAYGYQIDRRSSSRNSAVMKHPGGDKIIVAKAESGDWVYFSVRDPADHGSIIDFEQRRHSGTLGEIRKVLRAWLGGKLPAGAAKPATETYISRLDPVRKDIIGVRVRYEAMQPIDGQHDYLEHERKIPVHILTDSIFSERIRVDEHGNAIFPHFNKRDGLCGYEIKNYTFTGFSKGGVKGVWASKPGRDDRRLIIAETAIDALSYAALKGSSYSRFVSTAGEMSPDQLLLLQAAMQKLQPGSEVVLALDNDEPGEQIGIRIDGIFQSLGRTDLALVRDAPLTGGKDWNDQLRTSTSSAGPALNYRPKFPK